jgi:hypothetical protein
LVITALVMVALATFSLAMSTAWQNAGASQDILLQANQDVRLLDAKILPCALTGGWQPGALDGSASQPAAVLLWTADNNSTDRSLSGVCAAGGAGYGLFLCECLLEGVVYQHVQGRADADSALSQCDRRAVLCWVGGQRDGAAFYRILTDREKR